jgi:ribosome biogenesis GTPase
MNTSGTDATRLIQLGWDQFFSNAFAAIEESNLEPARVSIEHNHLFRVYTASTELLANVSGKLIHAASEPSALPSVGDWVAIRNNSNGPAQIREILPRKTCFARKASGDETKKQIVASNIDTVFLVSGLDHEFNPKRVQRYLVAAQDSGAKPVIVLNKGDLDKDPIASLDELKAIAPNISLHVTSCVDNRGIDELAHYLSHGKTVALLGSSGVGKSSLINQLLGYDRQSTQTVRVRDSRGRHTTVHRELLVHPTSGVIIDTPGMRELRLWDTSESLDATFDDLSSLAEHCRFRDCQHETEPGCAVKTAVEQGQISVNRLAHYLKLRSEQNQLDQRRLKLAELQEKQSTKQRPRQ